MTLSTKVGMQQRVDDGPIKTASLKWEKLGESRIQEYTQRLHDLVNATQPPPELLHCREKCRCRNESCQDAIQMEYDKIIALFKCADAPLPRYKPGVEKNWWTDNLTKLRDKSIEIQHIWIAEGRPHQGPTHDERLRAKAAYKCAIRAAQRAPKQASWDRLHSTLSESDTNTFWKSWRTLYNKNKSHLSPVVDGCSSSPAIAEAFKNSFSKNSTPNDKANVDKLDERFSAKYSEYVTEHEKSCDCKSSYISVPNVIDALFSMKRGKSADEEEMSAEHILHAPLNMLVRLTLLFNAMLKHAIVPKQFRAGFMVPIVKDQHGNKTDSNNYRGITISPIPSKLFEHVLKLVFFEYLSTSEHQFGFKKNSSTVHALHCLKQTVNYYVNNGSRVFCSFLDASKAFDRLVHSGLFLKLMERNVPLVFLDIIISWYDGLTCRVKWGNYLGDWFSITAGVRQGGVLSPDFYCIYVEDLLTRLKDLKKGCYFAGIFAAALFYADDMAILAPSIRGLNALLDICGAYCLEWDICLNAKKSRNLYFGKSIVITHEIVLNGRSIDWADEWLYLGVTLKSGKLFSCCVKERVKKFYRCANSILRIDGVSNDMVMLRLLEAHCIPLLTYAIEIIHVKNTDERRQLRVAYNSIFRKLFQYRWRESVTKLQHFLGKPTWEELIERRRSGFSHRLNYCGARSLVRNLPF